MGSKNVIGELLGSKRGGQAELARRAEVAKSTVSKAVSGGGMGWKAATKSAKALGVDEAALYAAVNLKSALEDDSTDDGEKLARIGRIVLTLGKHDVDEDAPGIDEVLTAIEEAIESLTEGAVDSVRGDKATKPGAKTATKGLPPMHAAFKSTFDRVGVGSVDPRDYSGDVGDGRGFHGERLSAARLRDQEESDFADISTYGTSNIPAKYDDEDDTEDRDAFGRSVRPMR